MSRMDLRYLLLEAQVYVVSVRKNPYRNPADGEREYPAGQALTMGSPLGRIAPP